MPCYQIQTTTVELGKVDPQLLDAAMQQLQIEKTMYAYDAQAGQIKLYGYARQTKIDEIKVAYSKQVVAKTATRFGWKLKTADGNKYTFTKR